MTKVDFNILKKAIADWESTVPINDALNQKAFRKHMLNEYGINVGLFTSECTVVDEKKYMMCILRWA